MPTSPASLLCCLSLALATTLSFSHVARADEPPVTASPPSPARALFKEGRELVAKGDYPAACVKFEQSLALEPGLGTQFNLADCWERIGRTASAQGLFVAAAASAAAAGQADREKILRDRAAALEPRIPRLVIEVSDPDPKLTVKRGDLPLESDSFGKARPVDPGSYEIVAKAPGKKTWSEKINVAAGAAIITVEVPRLEAGAPEAPSATVVAVAAKEEQKPKTSAPPPAKKKQGPSVATYALAGFGVAGLTLGTVMSVKYYNANTDAKATCPASVDCTPEQIAFHDQRVEEARTARTWAVVGFSAGVLGLGAAAATLFLAPSTDNEHALVGTPFLTADGSFGASLSGRF